MSKFQKYLSVALLFMMLFIVLYFIILKRGQKHFFKNCNIILISIDTLRADHLGCYDYPKNTSPNIDTFSKDSIIFKMCISQAPSTLASHASIFTSLIPSHHSAYFTKEQKLPEEIETLAEILHENGYSTISFNDGGQISSKFGMNQGFDLYDSDTEKVKPDYLYLKTIVDKGTDWIECNRKTRFFMFLHTYETHSPYSPKKNYLDLFESSYSGELPAHISVELINKINAGEIKITDEDKQHIINTYDAEIRSMDESFGKLVDFLKRTNLYDDTLIIFTSDHGEEFDEHGVMATHSHTLYNELLNVPLIVKFPHSKYASKKVNGLVGSIDISPTILDLINIKNFEITDGESLIKLIKGSRKNRKSLLISQQDLPFDFNDKRFWSIMNERWKLYNSKLFDLYNDHFEKSDISESHKEIVINFTEYAESFMQPKIMIAPERKIKLDKKLKEKLESLGYIKDN